MAIVQVLLVLALALLIVGAVVYALIRSERDANSDIDPRSARLARLALLPHFFDPLVARPLKRREIIGFLVLVAVMVAAIAFTGRYQ
jgi:hypothetical protein